MTDEHGVGRIGIQRAPRFIRDGDMAQRRTHIERDWAITEVQESTPTSR
jgi:hypothetical protein